MEDKDNRQETPAGRLTLPLKYRPMTFEDVVGQEHVIRTLRHALASGRVANAYLFVGSRGIGKTTLSRIFAKALNCLSPEGAEPCGKCANCRQIAEGRSLDVTEIDGASHNKVEDVHDIIESVKFAPSVSKYRIFIIDEVHMLTAAAFNALLKTLEEPPPHVKFIFATTEGDKVLPTIVSRCQRFDLRRIQTAQIASRLRKICEAEGVKATDDALLAIARGAEGGMRDALSSLDQLIAFSGSDIKEEDALSVFGLVSRKSLEDLAGAIIDGDAAAILRAVELFDSSGKNMRRLSGELMGHFRNVLVCKTMGEKAAPGGDLSPEQAQTVAAQAAKIDASRIFRIADLLSGMEDRLRHVLSVRTIMEMTLLKCARVATTATIEELMRAVRALKSGAAGGGGGGAAPAPADAPPEPVPAPKQKRAELPSAAEIMARSQPAPAPAPAAVAAAPAAAPQPQPESAADVATRKEILDDPYINDLLAALPGAKIAEIKTPQPSAAASRKETQNG